jgi:hypothetical protein
MVRDQVEKWEKQQQSFTQPDSCRKDTPEQYSKLTVWNALPAVTDFQHHTHALSVNVPQPCSFCTDDDFCMADHLLWGFYEKQQILSPAASLKHHLLH